MDTERCRERTAGWTAGMTSKSTARIPPTPPIRTSRDTRSSRTGQWLEGTCSPIVRLLRISTAASSHISTSWPPTRAAAWIIRSRLGVRGRKGRYAPDADEPARDRSAHSRLLRQSDDCLRGRRRRHKLAILRGQRLRWWRPMVVLSSQSADLLRPRLERQRHQSTGPLPSRRHATANSPPSPGLRRRAKRRITPACRMRLKVRPGSPASSTP